jgi:5-methylthioadenosine/S-adenosylhomocysteine deaminase
MSRIIIRGADIVTLDAEGAILAGSDLAIEGRAIAHVGEAPADFKPDEIVDAGGCVVMPGLFDAHCHSPMTFERGWAEDLPFPRWLNEKIWVAESALTPDDVYWGAMLAACEMIRSGIVAFNDHYFYMDRVARVVKQAGMKATLAWCVFGAKPEAEIGPGLDGTLDFIAEWHGAEEGRIRAVLGPHSPFSCPKDFLARIAGIAAERGVGVHLHVSESEEQVANSLAQHGQTPVAYLASLGIFDAPTVAAHALVLREADITILAEKGVSVVHCPITYMKLAMGVNDLLPVVAAGVNVALGTDGPASNNDLDGFAAIRQTALLQKHHTLDPEAMSGDLPLRMATQHGARAMGFEGSGVIAQGAPADLIVIDFARPHLRPRHSLIANLVYNVKSGDVRDAMVDGRWLMRDRALTTLDEPTILAEAEARAFRLVGSEMRQVREYRG